MWTWGWMEPPLGAFSFFLLCMSFSTQQRINLGIKPFKERLKARKADQLVTAYPQACGLRPHPRAGGPSAPERQPTPADRAARPQYDRYIVRDYAKAICFDDCDADGLDNEPLWLGQSRAALPHPGAPPEANVKTPNKSIGQGKG